MSYSIKTITGKHEYWKIRITYDDVSCTVPSYGRQQQQVPEKLQNLFLKYKWAGIYT